MSISELTFARLKFKTVILLSVLFLYFVGEYYVISRVWHDALLGATNNTVTF